MQGARESSLTRQDEAPPIRSSERGRQGSRRFLLIAGIVILVLLLIGIGFAAKHDAILYDPLILLAALTIVMALRTKGAIRYAIISGCLILGGLYTGIFFAANAKYDAWLDILYVSLIVLATLTLIVTALQVYAVLMLIRTISTVRNEMQPLLVSVQETVSVVKETAKTAGQTVSVIGGATRLTSEFALWPGIRAVSLLVAAQQMFRVFLGKGHTRNRAEERRRQQMNAIVGGE